MSFRSALLASAAILTAGSAFAADLPARVAAPAPYIAAPIFTWTGFYVGLNAGASFNNGNSGWGYSGFGNVVPLVYGDVGTSGNKSGFTGGVQAGYNWQFGSFVAGVEADINYIDRNNGNSAYVAPPAVGSSSNTGTPFYTISRNNGSNNYFGTVRGRLGFALDRALIYATGGLAWGGNRGGSTVTETVYTGSGPYTAGAPQALVSTGSNNSRVGWALGGGLEYAFSNAWSVKAEYLHVDLRGRNQSFASLTTQGGYINVSNNNKFDVVRAGVNFRF